MLYKYRYQCGVLPRSIAITLFDKMILPIVLYGLEVCGFEYLKMCESVQYDFCRRITISTNSSKLELLGEMGSYLLGKYLLALHYFQRCIKYWLNVIEMPTSKYPYAIKWYIDYIITVGTFGQLILHCCWQNLVFSMSEHSKESEMKMHFWSVMLTIKKSF